MGLLMTGLSMSFFTNDKSLSNQKEKILSKNERRAAIYQAIRVRWIFIPGGKLFCIDDLLSWSEEMTGDSWFKMISCLLATMFCK
jgi:hypothetical protein